MAAATAARGNPVSFGTQPAHKGPGNDDPTTRFILTPLYSGCLDFSALP
jgi:hypothetical protein